MVLLTKNKLIIEIETSDPKESLHDLQKGIIEAVRNFDKEYTQEYKFALLDLLTETLNTEK